MCLIVWQFIDVITQYGGLLWELMSYHYLPLGIFTLCTISIPAFPVLRMWYAGKAGFANLGGITVCFAVPVYYLSLVTFSASLLSYLPASRGGGDYSDASKVVLKLTRDFTRDAVTNLFLEPDSSAGSPANGAALKGKPTVNGAPSNVTPAPSGVFTRQCVWIEETSTALFIANPLDAAGPIGWRKSQADRPTVLAIDRKSILAVEYLHR
jgi:hypothetical protein